jgi:hypothetical protein
MRPHEAFEALRDARLEPVLLGVPTFKSDGYLEPTPPPPGTPAPAVVGEQLERAMGEITHRGLIAVVFQPERAVTSLEVKRQGPQPGEPTSFREVAIWLD